MKIFKVTFDGIYPIGSTLILAAENKEMAEEMARETIAHTDTFVVTEVDVSKPVIIEYLDGNY